MRSAVYATGAEGMVRGELRMGISRRQTDRQSSRGLATASKCLSHAGVETERLGSGTLMGLVAAARCGSLEASPANQSPRRPHGLNWMYFLYMSAIISGHDLTLIGPI